MGNRNMQLHDLKWPYIKTSIKQTKGWNKTKTLTKIIKWEGTIFQWIGWNKEEHLCDKISPVRYFYALKWFKSTCNQLNLFSFNFFHIFHILKRTVRIVFLSLLLRHYQLVRNNNTSNLNERLQQVTSSNFSVTYLRCVTVQYGLKEYLNIGSESEIIM